MILRELMKIYGGKLLITRSTLLIAITRLHQRQHQKGPGGYLVSLRTDLTAERKGVNLNRGAG